MKTLRIALFFIFGTIITLHSFAQGVKKENKAKIKMEVIDDKGNKKVIDTTFTIAKDQDYTEIMRKIKEDVGFSEEEVSKMKAELKANTKHLTVNLEEIMEHFDKDSMRKQMLIFREEMQSGKENLKKTLEELKVELESMKMNEKAMEKLEKAMEQFKSEEWNEHAKHLKEQMKNLQEHFEIDKNVFIMDGKHGNKQVWLDDDGEKRIIINMDIDMESDSLELSKMHNIMIMSDHDANDKNVWVEKDGEKIIIKSVKGGENMVFFGDDADLEKIHEIDGEHRVIVKKIKGEAAKGEAIFISDDAHVIKEFKEEDGNVKVMRYKMKSGDGEAKEMKMFMHNDDTELKAIQEKEVMISTANDELIAKAIQKGIMDAKAEELEMNNLTLNVDDEFTSLGTTFSEKGKLKVELFDAEMNQIWEENAGRVSGDWSTEIPSNLFKEAGKYYVLLTHGKKVKLILLGLN